MSDVRAHMRRTQYFEEGSSNPIEKRHQHNIVDGVELCSSSKSAAMSAIGDECQKPERLC